MVTLMNNFYLAQEYIHKSRLVEAYSAARNSPDPRTQVGAVLYNNMGERVAVGSNSFPSYVVSDKLKDLLSNKNKHLCLMHAERSALITVATKNISSRNLTLYAPYSACTQCAIELIAAGIKRIYRHERIMRHTPKRWRDDIANADRLFELEGVDVVEVKGKLGVEPILFDGKLRSF